MGSGCTKSQGTEPVVAEVVDGKETVAEVVVDPKKGQIIFLMMTMVADYDN